MFSRCLWQHNTDAILKAMNQRLTHLEATNHQLRAEIETLRSTVTSLHHKGTTMKDIIFYAGCTPTKLNLSTVLEYCSDAKFSTHVFCHRELPIRFAQQVVALDTMPHGLAIMPSVLKVKDLHLESFEDLRRLDVPTTPATCQRFNDVLGRVDERQSRVLMLMAEGLIELKLHTVRHKVKIVDENDKLAKAREILDTEYPDVKTSLDVFFRSMIGVNFLTRQHLEVVKQRQDPSSDQSIVGLVARNTNVRHVVDDAVEAARQICSQHFGDSPEVLVKRIGEGNTLDRAYIPSHIFYIVTELLKNALRATVEYSIFQHGEAKHQTSSGMVDCEGMPPIQVTIVDDPSKYEDVAILVQDRGGGFRRSNAPRVMSYMYTTAASILTVKGLAGLSSTSPLAGYGYGLPVSKLYARHFGGDLELTSMEGHGTEALLLIPSRP